MKRLVVFPMTPNIMKPFRENQGSELLASVSTIPPISTSPLSSSKESSQTKPPDEKRFTPENIEAFKNLMTAIYAGTEL